ncbi:MAG: hypothetical protein LVO36_04050 [Nitrosopumilus sp. (ex Thoosa mismalolli)]|nr:hypothetical protein [Nitrosopumilus sp. (ex Thoosa mismalolli)]
MSNPLFLVLSERQNGYFVNHQNKNHLLPNKKPEQVAASIIGINVLAMAVMLLVIAIILFCLSCVENYAQDPPNWFR